MQLIEDLEKRGLIQHSSADIKNIFSKKRTVYLGFDPTADSLQIGNLAVLLLLRRLALAGHTVVCLLGGATGQIGDPREKGERSMLAQKNVASNMTALRKQIKHILGSRGVRYVNNADWLNKTMLLPFLREVGKHFTVNELIKREIIKKRLDTPDESISFAEFAYGLLQGYDYLTLHTKYGVDLQVGASDQWANMLSGVELVRKQTSDEVFAFAIPLITDPFGKKFGKSEGNSVWLDPKKTTPFNFYQFWLRQPDANIEQYLKVYTFLPLEDIETLLQKHREDPSAHEAQETLARLVTEIVHGPSVTAQVVDASSALFGTEQFGTLQKEAQAVALAEAPRLTVKKADLPRNTVAELLVESGLAPSKNEARRLVGGRGISLNSAVITDAEMTLSDTDFINGYATLKKGKQGIRILVLK